MKLFINGEQVEIRVKGRYSSRANKMDTMAFLNTLCCFIGEGQKQYEELGLNALAQEAKETRGDIFRQLVDEGYYND